MRKNPQKARELGNPLLDESNGEDPELRAQTELSASKRNLIKRNLIKRINAYLDRTLLPDPEDTFTWNDNTIEIKPEKRQVLKDLRNLLEKGESTSLPSSVETALDDGLSTSDGRLSTSDEYYQQAQESAQAAARNSYKALYYRALVQEPLLMKPSDGPAYVVPHPKSQVSRMVVEACKRFGSGFLEYEKTSSTPDLPILRQYREQCLKTLSVDAKNYLLRTADVVEHKVGPDGEFIKTYTPHFEPKVALVKSLQETIKKLQNGIEPEDGELENLYQRALDQAYVRRKDGCLGLFGRPHFELHPGSRVNRIVRRLCKEFDPDFSTYQKTCTPGRENPAPAQQQVRAPSPGSSN